MAASAQNYSIVSLSYDNTQLWYGSNPSSKAGLSALGHESNSASLNGFGIQYSYGIGLGDKPMNVEVGLKFSMGFDSAKESESYSGITVENKVSTQLMRLGIPVSYIYHFNINDQFAIAPYAGLDFRFNLLAKSTYKATAKGSVAGVSIDEEEKSTLDWFKKDGDNGVGEFSTFNRFQMGWHVGVRFEYTKLFLGLEYGTDFIPAMSHSEDGFKHHINTGNFALSVGCKF